MTIASEIQRIQTNIANAYDALEAKGATMPVTENTDNLVTTINTISGGSGDVITATNNTGSAITSGEKVWLNESGGNYNTVDFYSSQKNLCFGQIGTPTIDSDYIASGFNNSIGFVGPFAFPFGTADSWEIGFKVKTSYIPGGTGINYQIFFASSTPTSGLLDIMQKSGGIIFIYPSGHVFLQGAYSSSSDAPDVSIRTTNMMTVNTWEYIKVGFTGTKYYIAQSSDGVNWTQGDEFSSTTKLYQPTYSFSLGATFSSSGYAFNNGSIDLKEGYIIVNGVKTWIPIIQSANVDENSLTGYAQENIASGSTGDVLTLLPPE